MASLGKYRVLITGISGFTGRHLADALAGYGWEIVGLGDKQLPVESDHIKADLADTSRLSDWIAHVRPTHIVHLAALSHVVGDPLSFYRVNVLGTESLFEAVSRSGIVPEKVLIASSANIYGNASQSPISEDAPVRPVNHYALSKAAMELLAEKWFEKMPIVLVRPFNYTGTGQSKAFVFPKIVAAYRSGDAVLRLGNLDVARDLSDVRFVCEAYRRLLVSDARSERFNVCSGRSVTLLSVLDIMAEISGHRPRIEVDSVFVRKDEIIDLRGDPAKLLAQIGPLEPFPLRKILESMFTGRTEDGQR